LPSVCLVVGIDLGSIPRPSQPKDLKRWYSQLPCLKGKGIKIAARSLHLTAPAPLSLVSGLFVEVRLVVVIDLGSIPRPTQPKYLKRWYSQLPCFSTICSWASYLTRLPVHLSG